RVEFARGALEALGIPAGEDQLGPLSACSSGRFEPNAGAPADHDDGLPEKFRFALDGRGGGCAAHDSSVQQAKTTLASRRDVRYFLRREASPDGFGNRFTAAFYAPLTHSSRQTGSLRPVSGFGGIYTPSTMR